MNLSPQFTLDREVDADAEAPVKISAQGVNVFYGEKQALFDVSLDMPDKQVTALIGPSGCGKSTFLRCMNRMNDTILGCKVQGRIELDGEDVNERTLDPVLLRARVGMVSFVPGVPAGLTSAATVLPVQVFIWENASERAFHERTAAAIMVLLVFMILMNLAAILLRRRFERRW